jgi:hypothetical protein
MAAQKVVRLDGASGRVQALQALASIPQTPGVTFKSVYCLFKVTLNLYPVEYVLSSLWFTSWQDHPCKHLNKASWRPNRL